jgi:3-dehydroquinate dehydratase
MALGLICGFGAHGYWLALEALSEKLAVSGRGATETQ